MTDEPPIVSLSTHKHEISIELMMHAVILQADSESSLNLIDKSDEYFARAGCPPTGCMYKGSRIVVWWVDVTIFSESSTVSQLEAVFFLSIIKKKKAH